jgi:hypothetical protein
VLSHRPRVFQRPSGVILVARAGVSDAGTQTGVGVIGCTAQAMTSDCPSRLASGAAEVPLRASQCLLCPTLRPGGHQRSWERSLRSSEG